MGGRSRDGGERWRAHVHADRGLRALAANPVPLEPPERDMIAAMAKLFAPLPGRRFAGPSVLCVRPSRQH